MKELSLYSLCCKYAKKNSIIGVTIHHHQLNILKYPQNDKNKLLSINETNFSFWEHYKIETW
ncbi:hypothetical protein F3I01_18055 [Bacillus sp. SRB1LM]|nr:hypothetical protein [Bacillus sp. SRB1LM]